MTDGIHGKSPDKVIICFAHIRCIIYLICCPSRPLDTARPKYDNDRPGSLGEQHQVGGTSCLEAETVRVKQSGSGSGRAPWKGARRNKEKAIGYLGR